MRFHLGSSPRFILSFLIGLGLWGWGLNWGLGELNRKINSDLSAQQMNFLRHAVAHYPTSYLGTSNDNSIIRANRQFLVKTINGVEFPLRVFENPQLFAEAFPGYSPEIQKDPVWSQYFREAFNDPNVWLPSLADPDQAFLTPNLVMSWLGGIDLFDAFGADVVLLGTSEVSTGLIPAWLARDLAGVIADRPRVLRIGGPAQYATIVHLTAQTLAATGKKSRLTIWGYSFWDAFLRGKPRLAAVNAKLAEYQVRYPGRAFQLIEPARTFLSEGASADSTGHEINLTNRFFQTNLSQWFPPLKWDFVFAEATLAMANQTPLLFWHQWRQPEFSRFDEEEGYRVRLDLVTNEAALTRVAGQVKSQYPYLNGINDEDCQLSESRQILEQTVAEILKSSERLVIFIPPVTPELIAGLPRCFLPAVQEMLESVRSARVHIIAAGNNDFGLEHRDFVYPGLLAGYASINVNHPNFLGAQKVNAKVTAETIRWLRNSTP